MPPKRSGGEGSKKSQGQARKADAASAKKATQEAENAAAESQKWEKGAKDSSKKYVCKNNTPPSLGDAWLSSILTFFLFLIAQGSCGSESSRGCPKKG
jgi:hypothetical protein